MTVDFYNLNYKIIILAPANCLQYQNSLIGQIKSFNFEEFQVGAGTGYLSGLDYAICFKKPPGYCSVTYTVPRQLFADVGQSIIHQTTQTQTNYQVNPGQYFNIIGMVGNDQAGAGHYECPQDYLQLANIPLCGSRLNNQLFPPTPNPTTNAEVVGKYRERFLMNCRTHSAIVSNIYVKPPPHQIIQLDRLLQDLSPILTKLVAAFCLTTDSIRVWLLVSK